jgi:RND family efflux transporter MFP subunit
MRNTIAAAAAAAVFSGCSGATEAPPGPAAFPPAAVKLKTASLEPVAEATEYVAMLKSLRSTAVQPQIDGQIVEIMATSGQRVARGTPLVQIDARRQEAAVSSQQAERAAREADVAFARQQHQRATELLGAGAISKQELEAAVTTLQTAEARLKALDAQVQQQQVQLRYYTVTAPTAGVVGDVPVRVGNMVTPQTVLTTIDQNDTLEVHVQVPIERAPELKNGLAIEIVSSDGQEKLATSEVNFISPHVDEGTQSILTKGVVRNPDGRLRAQQFVRARIVWRTSEGLTVPVTAMLRISGQFFAFVAEESKGPDGRPMLVARQRPVTVGPIEGDSYTVRSGLKPGERVVVSGVQKLADGAPITVNP